MKPKYWTILILASAVIIVSVLYYLRQPAPYSGLIVVPRVSKTQPQATTTPQIYTTASTSPATSSPTIQAQTGTSGWQTYTNAQYGFSFEYPDNWYSNSTVTQNTVYVEPPDEDGEGGNGISISKLNSLKDEQIDTSTYSILNQQLKTYNGMSWNLVNYQEKDSGMEFYTAFIEHNGIAYSVSSANFNSIMPVIDRVLSSFQFIK